MPTVNEPAFEPRGVLVIGPGRARCSGALLSEGGAEGSWVLTSGAVLGSSFLRHIPVTDMALGRLMYPSVARQYNPFFSVILQKTPSSTTGPDKNMNERAKDASFEDSPTVEYTASVAAMWRCALVSQTLHTLFKAWKLTSPLALKKNTPGGGDDGGLQEEEKARVSLPLFVLLRVADSSTKEMMYLNPSELLSGASSVLFSLLRRLEANGVGGNGKDGGWWRGRRLLLESSPFGNTVFFNSWSEGIAGGAAGPQSCVLMADIRAAPGCEGAPAFLLSPSSHSHAARPYRRIGPVALTVAVMSWWRGEWVGFTLLAALPPVLRCVLNVYSVPAAPLQTPSAGGGLRGVHLETSVTGGAAVEAGLVLVRCGGEWGSGVVISVPAPAPSRGHSPPPRLVLTCSHVVTHAPEPGEDDCDEVGVGRWGDVSLWWRGRRLPARLLFRSPTNKAFDVAVLQLQDEGGLEPAPTALPLSSTSPSKGDRILCAGFPLLADTTGTGPLVSAGRIAKVTPGVMLQATCIAQAGASGGALLRSCAGGVGVEVVGIVASNIRDDASGILFPHFCLATPSDALYPTLSAFVSSADVTTLNALMPEDEATQRLWVLQPPKSHSAPPPARL